jgi:hypothetical protein
MDSQRPEPSGAVKARGAQRSDRRSRLGLDGEHGSGTQALEGGALAAGGVDFLGRSL